MGDLRLDQLFDALAQIDRRHRDLFQARRARVAGHEIEQPRRVVAEAGIASKERQIGITRAV